MGVIRIITQLYRITQLLDAQGLFTLFRNLYYLDSSQHFVFLESGRAGKKNYLACFPLRLITLKDCCFETTDFFYLCRKVERIHEKKKTMFVAAEYVYTTLRKQLLSPLSNHSSPFPLAWFGYFSYTFVRYTEQTAINPHYRSQYPDACFICPGILFIEDIITQQISVEITYRNNIEKKYFEDIIAAITKSQTQDTFFHQCEEYKKRSCIKNLRSSFSKKEYLQAIAKAKHYLYEGESYQIKLSQKISCDFTGDPFLIYQQLRKLNPSPYNAFLRFYDKESDIIVISNSPEQLLEVTGKRAVTRPIAGTYPKQAGLVNHEKAAIKKRFLADEKESAEHVMLVDLERNDLGKVCGFGSVVVQKLMAVEEYSHLFHIVSTIKGRLCAAKDAYDALLALFPGGTITGCPKRRTMEIIAQLEPCSRELYTGNIGYFLNDLAQAQFSIAIRTLFLQKVSRLGNRKNDCYKLSLHVGGGIVAASQPQREYAETLWKAYALLKSLGLNIDGKIIDEKKTKR